jgi:hypothetical protein
MLNLIWAPDPRPSGSWVQAGMPCVRSGMACTCAIAPAHAIPERTQGILPSMLRHLSVSGRRQSGQKKNWNLFKKDVSNCS